ncbi:MAG: hypothetical protein AAB394_00365 [Patescibacteria group bacterium]
MIKISERPNVCILCEVKCPVCGNFKKPIDTRLIEVCYTGADGSLTGWAVITNCCQAILFKSYSFSGVLNLLAISNSHSSHIKIVRPPSVLIEVLEIKEPAPN